MKTAVISEKTRKNRFQFGPDAKSVIFLMGVLALAKVATLLPLFLFSDIPRSSFLHELGTKWDSNFYVQIAEFGYKAASNPGTKNAFAFSPVLPSLIAVAKLFTGSYWIAGLLVVNAFSFFFPIIIFKLSDFKTALITELFPVYLVFSTLTYPDVITLCFLALSLYFFLRRRRYFLAGVSLAIAVLTSYIVILTVPIFVVKICLDRRPERLDDLSFTSVLKDLFKFVVPVILACLAIAAFFLGETGSLWTFFGIEKSAGWDVGFVSPFQQVQFLLHGWFTGFHWMVMGNYLPPIYWTLRNLAFEVFYVTGVILLISKRRLLPNSRFLSALALALITPLFFLGGVAAASIPRLLLPAFMAFFGYSSGAISSKKSVILYGALCLAIAPLIALVQLDALFS